MRALACFSAFSFTILMSFSLVGQNCEDASNWIVKASRADSVINNCISFQNVFNEIINDCLIEKDSFEVSMGDLYYALGGVYYFCDLESKAIENIQRSIKARKNTTNLNFGDIGRSYWMLGNIYLFLGQNIKTNEALKEATIYLEQASLAIKNEYLPSCYGSLSQYYKDIGDYAQALLYAEEALQNIDPKELHEIFRFKKIKANILEQLNDHEAAVEELLTCKHLLERIGVRKNLRSYASTFSDIGYLHLLLGDYVAAQEALSRSISVFESIEKPEFINVIITYNHLIKLQIQQKDYDAAMTSINQSLQILQEHPKLLRHPRVGELYYLSGEVYAAKNDFSKAFSNFRKAEQIFLPGFSPESISQNPALSKHSIGDKIRLRSSLLLKAETYQQKYKIEQQLPDLITALDTYVTLDTLLTLTRQDFNAVASKYQLQKTIIPIYEAAINVALQLFKLTGNPTYRETAYDFIARNKAIILIEGLQDEKVKYAAIPPALLQKESNLKKASYELEIAIYQNITEKDSDITQILEDSLFVIKRNYEKLIQSFEQNYPNYFQHKHDSYSKLNISNIQSTLEADKAILEFFLGEEHLFVAVVTNNHFEIYKSALPENFSATCYDFIGMARGEENRMKEEKFANTAYLLYQILLQQGLSDLDQSINRLTLIPDDILLHLPFDLLMTTPFSMDNEDWNKPNIPYLIKKYATSQVYARSLLFDKAGKNKIDAAQKEFAGFGIEYFDFTKKGIPEITDSLLQERISGRLIYSDDEVLAIQEIIGGNVFINKAATKQEFLATAEQYRFLHFATHGIADEKQPLNSCLVFAKLAETNDKDWLLRASDLYSMGLNASMVVLSACQTNYGSVQKGEGMRTLSRAFSFAGCKALVASLWNISDQSSKKIFTFFYQNIHEGLPKDLALRQAKLSYLNQVDDINQALPHRWAQTVLIGDTAQVEFNSDKSFSFKQLIICAFLSLFVIIGLWSKYMKRS